MDKNNLKDAYDIGENIAVFSGEGRSYTIINKETGKTRQLVSEDGSLLVTDNEIDFDAIYKGCPDFNGCKSVHYCPVKILDLEINRVDHHPLGR